MAKDTYYFSHDFNARQDEKIKRLIRKHNMSGYGIYWSIVEDLYNNANALQTDYDGIAFDLHSDVETVKSIINDFDLFVFEDDMFGSLSIERRLNERNLKSKKASLSAHLRWEKYRLNANALQTHSEGNAIKEKKGNEIKEKESINPPTKILGFNYRPLYEDTNEEFRKMYDKIFYTSWLSINEYLDNNCKFLRMWENQITIYEFKKIYDRIQKKEISINHVRQALLDLDGSRQAKEKYNSVNHGLNTFIKTALKNV